MVDAEYANKLTMHSLRHQRLAEAAEAMMPPAVSDIGAGHNQTRAVTSYNGGRHGAWILAGAGYDCSRGEPDRRAAHVYALCYDTGALVMPANDPCAKLSALTGKNLIDQLVTTLYEESGSNGKQLLKLEHDAQTATKDEQQRWNLRRWLHMVSAKTSTPARHHAPNGDSPACMIPCSPPPA